MGSEEIESYQNTQELGLFREYRDLVPIYRYSVETERRLYLANKVDVKLHNSGGDIFFEVEMEDAWVWDIYRQRRFLNHVRVYSFKDVNVEEITPSNS